MAHIPGPVAGTSQKPYLQSSPQTCRLSHSYLGKETEAHLAQCLVQSYSCKIQDSDLNLFWSGAQALSTPLRCPRESEYGKEWKSVGLREVGNLFFFFLFFSLKLSLCFPPILDSWVGKKSFCLLVMVLLRGFQVFAFLWETEPVTPAKVSHQLMWFSFYERITILHGLKGTQLDVSTVWLHFSFYLHLKQVPFEKDEGGVYFAGGN